MVVTVKYLTKTTQYEKKRIFISLFVGRFILDA